MDKAIEIIENKLKKVEKYLHIESFKSRQLILKDVLKELKSVK
jgi:hypothetical protein